MEGPLGNCTALSATQIHRCALRAQIGSMGFQPMHYAKVPKTGAFSFRSKRGSEVFGVFPEMHGLEAHATANRVNRPTRPAFLLGDLCGRSRTESSRQRLGVRRSSAALGSTVRLGNGDSDMGLAMGVCSKRQGNRERLSPKRQRTAALQNLAVRRSSRGLAARHLNR